MNDIYADKLFGMFLAIHLVC